MLAFALRHFSVVWRFLLGMCFSLNCFTFRGLYVHRHPVQLIWSSPRVIDHVPLSDKGKTWANCFHKNTNVLLSRTCHYKPSKDILPLHRYCIFANWDDLCVILITVCSVISTSLVSFSDYCLLYFIYTKYYNMLSVIGHNCHQPECA